MFHLSFVNFLNNYASIPKIHLFRSRFDCINLVFCLYPPFVKTHVSRQKLVRIAPNRSLIRPHDCGYHTLWYNLAYIFQDMTADYYKMLFLISRLVSIQAEPYLKFFKYLLIFPSTFIFSRFSSSLTCLEIHASDIKIFSPLYTLII